MNERIQELIAQASSWVEVEIDSGTDSVYELLLAEKFAELIVRECANIADKAEPYKASDLIKKHFGF